MKDFKARFSRISTLFNDLQHQQSSSATTSSSAHHHHHQHHVSPRRHQQPRENKDILTDAAEISMPLGMLPDLPEIPGNSSRLDIEPSSNAKPPTPTTGSNLPPAEMAATSRGRAASSGGGSVPTASALFRNFTATVAGGARRSSHQSTPQGQKDGGAAVGAATTEVGGFLNKARVAVESAASLKVADESEEGRQQLGGGGGGGDRGGRGGDLLDGGGGDLRRHDNSDEKRVDSAVVAKGMDEAGGLPLGNDGSGGRGLVDDCEVLNSQASREQQKAAAGGCEESRSSRSQQSAVSPMQQHSAEPIFEIGGSDISEEEDEDDFDSQDADSTGRATNGGAGNFPHISGFDSPIGHDGHSPDMRPFKDGLPLGFAGRHGPALPDGFERFPHIAGRPRRLAPDIFYTPSRDGPPVLCIIVVGFHHIQGPVIEFVHPPEFSDSAQDSVVHQTSASDLQHAPFSLWKRHLRDWKREVCSALRWVPFLALPDASHRSEAEYVYFMIPSVDGHTPLYGVSCYRQISADALDHRDSGITRDHVQKAVCVLSQVPFWGILQLRLEPVTFAYFEQRDFRSTDILAALYEQLTKLEFENYKYPDLLFNLEALLPPLLTRMRLKFLLILVKAMMLEAKIVVYSASAAKASSSVLVLLALMPGLLTLGYNNRGFTAFHRIWRQLGFPLQIFHSECILYPYLSLQLLDGLVQARGFLVGATNRVLLQYEALKPDLIVDVDRCRLQISNKEFQTLLTPTDYELKFLKKRVESILKSHLHEAGGGGQATGLSPRLHSVAPSPPGSSAPSSAASSKRNFVTTDQVTVDADSSGAPTPLPHSSESAAPQGGPFAAFGTGQAAKALWNKWRTQLAAASSGAQPTGNPPNASSTTPGSTEPAAGAEGSDCPAGDGGAESCFAVDAGFVKTRISSSLTASTSGTPTTSSSGVAGGSGVGGGRNIKKWKSGGAGVAKMPWQRKRGSMRVDYGDGGKPGVSGACDVNGGGGRLIDSGLHNDGNFLECAPDIFLRDSSEPAALSGAAGGQLHAATSDDARAESTSGGVGIANLAAAATSAGSSTSTAASGDGRPIEVITSVFAGEEASAAAIVTTPATVAMRDDKQVIPGSSALKQQNLTPLNFRPDSTGSATSSPAVVSSSSSSFSVGGGGFLPLFGGGSGFRLLGGGGGADATGSPIAVENFGGGDVGGLGGGGVDGGASPLPEWLNGVSVPPENLTGVGETPKWTASFEAICAEFWEYASRLAKLAAFAAGPQRCPEALKLAADEKAYGLRDFNGDFVKKWADTQNCAVWLQQHRLPELPEYAKPPRNGWAKYTYSNGDEFSGQFQNGLRHGQGTYLARSGMRYEGSWHFDRRHGEGVFWHEGTGYMYSGEWQWDRKQGQGHLYSKYERYWGGFENDKFNGKGTYVDRKGNHYEGNFAEGLFHGAGKLTRSSGEVCRGEWRLGKLRGMGNELLPDGRNYAGNFKNSVFWGHGSMTNNDDTVFEGQWSAGVRNGEGVLTVPARLYAMKSSSNPSSRKNSPRRRNNKAQNDDTTTTTTEKTLNELPANGCIEPVASDERQAGSSSQVANKDASAEPAEIYDDIVNPIREDDANDTQGERLRASHEDEIHAAAGEDGPVKTPAEGHQTSETRPERGNGGDNDCARNCLATTTSPSVASTSTGQPMTIEGIWADDAPKGEAEWTVTFPCGSKYTGQLLILPSPLDFQTVSVRKIRICRPERAKVRRRGPPRAGVRRGGGVETCDTGGGALPRVAEELRTASASQAGDASLREEAGVVGGVMKDFGERVSGGVGDGDGAATGEAARGEGGGGIKFAGTSRGVSGEAAPDSLRTDPEVSGMSVQQSRPGQAAGEPDARCTSQAGGDAVVESSFTGVVGDIGARRRGSPVRGGEEGAHTAGDVCDGTAGSSKHVAAGEGKGVGRRWPRSTEEAVHVPAVGGRAANNAGTVLDFMLEALKASSGSVECFAMPHGRGISKAAQSGETYDGEWFCGMRHGQGESIMSDGTKYRGEWCFGLRHGFGAVVEPGGNLVSGFFRRGAFDMSATEYRRHKSSHQQHPTSVEAPATTYASTKGDRFAVKSGSATSGRAAASSASSPVSARSASVASWADIASSTSSRRQDAASGSRIFLDTPKASEVSPRDWQPFRPFWDFPIDRSVYFRTSGRLPYQEPSAYASGIVRSTDRASPLRGPARRDGTGGVIAEFASSVEGSSPQISIAGGFASFLGGLTSGASAVNGGPGSDSGGIAGSVAARLLDGWFASSAAANSSLADFSSAAGPRPSGNSSVVGGVDSYGSSGSGGGVGVAETSGAGATAGSALKQLPSSILSSILTAVTTPTAAARQRAAHLNAESLLDEEMYPAPPELLNELQIIHLDDGRGDKGTADDDDDDDDKNCQDGRAGAESALPGVSNGKRAVGGAATSKPRRLQTVPNTKMESDVEEAEGYQASTTVLTSSGGDFLLATPTGNVTTTTRKTSLGTESDGSIDLGSNKSVLRVSNVAASRGQAAEPNAASLNAGDDDDDEELKSEGGAESGVAPLSAADGATTSSTMTTAQRQVADVLGRKPKGEAGGKGGGGSYGDFGEFVETEERVLTTEGAGGDQPLSDILAVTLPDVDADDEGHVEVGEVFGSRGASALNICKWHQQPSARAGIGGSRFRDNLPPGGGSAGAAGTVLAVAAKEEAQVDEAAVVVSEFDLRSPASKQSNHLGTERQGSDGLSSGGSRSLVDDFEYLDFEEVATPPSQRPEQS